MPTFQTYLDDLNSSTGCCRSASILIPTKGNDANAILRTLQKVCLNISLTHDVIDMSPNIISHATRAVELDVPVRFGPSVEHCQ